MRHLQGICLIVLLMCVPIAASAQQKLVLSTIERSPNGAIGAAVLKVAYKKLGIEVEVYQTSGKRSLMVSSSGTVDGEVLRIGAVAQSFPTLIQIDVPIKKLKLAVFRKKSELTSWTFDDLPELRVGQLAGAVRLDTFTKNYSDVWRGHSNRELFEMLQAGNLDAIVIDYAAGKLVVRELGLTTIEVLEKTIDEEDMFHFLHEKHVTLVPEITRVLKEMESTGEINGIVKETMENFEIVVN
ncbi:Bacterial extracellular solute-binding proteins, family 3 [Roseibium album]|nr:Bacterial extracellular solute-binding proteins, family 3 [Roseibium album]